MIIGGHFDYDNKIIELEKLESERDSEGFWNNPSSKDILSKISLLKSNIRLFEETVNNLNTLKDIMSMDMSSEEEELLLSDIESLKKDIEKDFDELKMSVLLSGEFDQNNAYIEIHSGAGGTESNDWADMLKRMYLKYLEKNDYKVDIISEQPGEEVGIKGIIIHASKPNAFGLLKGESGVHRLVRISPFDANKRRHTSFASVLVTPEIDTNVKVDIKEEDIKIDVYRSSGAGGQSVNTTDSAVRITHLPTKIVVTCQNERSQIKNKEKALEILKGKLYLLEKETMDAKINELKGAVMDVNFGSQIRNYFLEPYKLVKDLRTNYETSNADAVLNGDIEDFIESYLKS